MATDAAHTPSNPVRLEDLGLPAGFAPVAEIDLQPAIDMAQDALGLSPDATRDSLAAYYDVESNYAGAAFATLGRNDPFDITADDLHAVSMLSVTVEPFATRRLLEPGEPRERVIAALQRVPIDLRLRDASGEHLEACWEFHAAVKAAIGRKTDSNPWVTAAKITARKRPHLIPVRDNVVGKGLGNGAVESASIYWQIMRGLLRTPEVAEAIAAARVRLATDAHATGRTIVVDVSDLRLLDAALWMHLIRQSTSADPAPAEDQN